MKAKARPVNLFDVARLAGVSTATVSRTLNGGQVRKSTRQTVERAIRQLGYVAHGAARALSSRRNYTFGAVIPDLDNAIFASTTSALQKAFDEQGYMLIVACNFYDIDVELRLTRNLIERGIDGLVLVGTEHRPELFALLHDFGIPYVLTWAHDETGQLPSVGCDHRKAMAGLTQYLLELGHRDFAVISGITKNNDRVRQRLAGVLDTLEAAGVKTPRERIVEGPFSYRAGQAAMETFLAMERAPTAVMCLNDVPAIGAMSACNAAGLRVPGDISITGCVDLEVASMVQPPLTSVHFPTADMGHYAGIYLLAQINGAEVRKQQVLPTRLVVRGSTAPPRRRDDVRPSAPSRGSVRPRSR